MKVGVVDIGTNSMRLLITRSGAELGRRWVEVTGLGRGVDHTGVLDEAAVARTVETLTRFGEIMEREKVDARAAIATSATRDARNRESFLEQVTRALGVVPEVISGDREGRLAFAGATADLEEPAGWLVCDIGGGSTELAGADFVRSVDIGSVRLTERALPDRPATSRDLARAATHLDRLFADVSLPRHHGLVGVAGTWTSLAAIHLGLEEHDGAAVHHHVIEPSALQGLIGRLASLTVEETAAIPSLDPGRAPVILAGAVVAGAVNKLAGGGPVLVSERDSLDGLAAELMDLA